MNRLKALLPEPFHVQSKVCYAGYLLKLHFNLCAQSVEPDELFGMVWYGLCFYLFSSFITQEPT